MIEIVQGRGSFLELLAGADILERGVRTELASLAREAKADLVQTLRAPKTGAEYGRRRARFYKLVSGVALRKSKDARAYRASAPGEAPASRTGALARAVRTARPSRGQGFTQMVFVDRRVAFFRHMLEFGTKTIAPRPFMGPLVAHYDAIAGQRLQTALDRAAGEINARNA